MTNEEKSDDPMVSSGLFGIAEKNEGQTTCAVSETTEIAAFYIVPASKCFKEGDIKRAITILKQGLDKTGNVCIEKIIGELLILQRLNEAERFEKIAMMNDHRLTSPFETLCLNFIIKDGKITKSKCKERFVIIPGNVTEIGEKAFYESDSLYSLIISENIEKIGIEAFRKCIHLKDLYISGNKTIICASAFAECHSLKRIILPEEITEIPEMAFYFCISVEDIHIPETVLYIRNNAFGYCIGLKSISLPSALKTIGDFSFVDCTGLSSVTFPENTETIGDFAFHGCSDLTSITVYSGLKYIGAYAFSGCNNLRHVFFKGTKTDWNSIVKGDSAIPEKADIHTAS